MNKLFKIARRLLHRAWTSAIVRGAVVVLIVGFVTMGAWVYLFCHRNATVQTAWSNWYASRRSNPPGSWTDPDPANLARFASDTEFWNDYGLKMPLLGYKDDSGNIVIRAQFAACGEHFYNGLARATVADESGNSAISGYITPDGEWAIVLDGVAWDDFEGNLARFRNRSPTLPSWPIFGYVDRQGNVIVPMVYSRASFEIDGYMLVGKRTLIGRIEDALTIGLGITVESCLHTTKYILDLNGDRVDPKQLRTPRQQP